MNCNHKEKNVIHFLDDITFGYKQLYHLHTGVIILRKNPAQVGDIKQFFSFFLIIK